MRPLFLLSYRSGFKNSLKDQAVDIAQLVEGLKADMLIHLMHRGANAAEFNHRAIQADEPCIGCAAGGGQGRLLAGDLFDRRANGIR